MSRIPASSWRFIIPPGLILLFALNMPAKKNPAQELSGHDIFLDRCSACHGEDAKGNGPAVSALKIAPGDLTLLAKKNGGTFPKERVKNIVGDWVDITAHGSRETPIWGNLFHARPADQQRAADRLKSLISYLESIQR